VAAFAPWIKCVKKYAEAGYSHKNVDRECIKSTVLNNRFLAVPFNFDDIDVNDIEVRQPNLEPEEQCDPKKAEPVTCSG